MQAKEIPTPEGRLMNQASLTMAAPLLGSEANSASATPAALSAPALTRAA